jgi:hypothetical protein
MKSSDLAKKYVEILEDQALSARQRLDKASAFLEANYIPKAAPEKDSEPEEVNSKHINNISAFSYRLGEAKQLLDQIINLSDKKEVLKYIDDEDVSNMTIIAESLEELRDECKSAFDEVENV